MFSNQQEHNITNKKWLPLRVLINSHKDISRLGLYKIVATPHSGYEPRKILNIWLNLNEENKNHVITLYKKQWKLTLGIFVYYNKDGIIPNPFMGNIIIFYITEYLQLLSLASNKSINDLLNIFAVVQTEKYNKDLIKIAFGDIFGQTYDNTPLETIDGRDVLHKYNKYIEDFKN